MSKLKGLKLYSLLTLIIVLLVFSACSNPFIKDNKDKKDNSSKPDSSTVVTGDNKYCFWEVTSNNSKGKLYLFGSIHAADKTAYPLPSSIMDAYDDSDCIAVECDIVQYEKDFAKQVELSTELIYYDGTTIQDHINKELYENLKQILTENKSYMNTYDLMKPAAWMSLVDGLVVKKSGLSTNKGLDRYFLKKAKTDKKEILEVESVEFQTQMLANFSDDVMNLLLKTYTEYSIEEQAESLKELYEAWKAGDLESLYDIGSGEEDDLTEAEKALYEEYNKQMLTDRNNGMVEKAEQYLAEGRNCFYIVGAMHMLGDDGIVEQLKAKGYTVNRIY